VSGTTPVHKKLMKDKPTTQETEVKPEVKPSVDSALKREIYLRLISASASDGKFDLGKLPNAKAVVSQGDHLRGVAELLTQCLK
jgi:hypothetical protein